MAYDWTDERLETLRTMRRNSASTVTIARTLGGISAKTVGRKLKEMGLNGKYRWPEEKIEILRRGYAQRHTPAQIAKRLGVGYTAKAIAAKASELGISKRTDWSGNDEDFFEYLHATGLPQKDILHHMSDYPDGQVRYRIARKREEHSPLNFDQRMVLREHLKKAIDDLIGRNEEDFGVKVAAWIAASRQHTGRDLREISMICLLPIAFIERVFARLDLEGVWPLTAPAHERLGPDAYRSIAAICNEEKGILQGMDSFWDVIARHI